jgi:hypothetical protein
MIKLIDMRMAPVEFTDWFNRFLYDQKWGVREAARRIGISHPVVSNLLAGELPTEGTCVKIAFASKYPTDFILSMAGYKEDYHKDPLVDLITNLAGLLPTEEQKHDTAEYIRLQIRLSEERGNYESTHKEERPPKVE